MKKPIIELLLIGCLLMMVISPLAGLAPIMVVLFGFGVFWILRSLAQIVAGSHMEKDEDRASS
ncbi:MAG TPA: hypothetical protein V6C95_13665 [Coleofasciculaceae cyanobacterium]